MIYGDGWRFVENPSTGSTAVANWLLRHADGRRPPDVLKHEFPFKHNPGMVTFGVIRHPYDRLVSAWRRKYYNTDFNVWLDSHPLIVGPVDLLRTPQETWLWLCDVILNYEELDLAFAMIAKDMGWPNEPLPVENQAIHPGYPKLLPHSVTKILDRFKLDFDHYAWGTEFGDRVRVH